ncbi:MULTISPECIES: imidazole glycerol phosphate synthase subunit HisH [unclassified Lysobacter]
MSKVVLIDAGGANLGSVRYALERLGTQVQVTSRAEDIASAERVILPGVGAAAGGMVRLRELGLVEVLRDLRQPLLGICLGMQLLYDSSEEGEVECLGLIPGRIAKLTPDNLASRVPHMGWNRLQVRREDPLLAGIDDGAQVYFVHSYAAPLGNATLASSRNGQEFSAVVRSGNRHGMQFHPERSAAVGARLLANFLSVSS